MYAGRIRIVKRKVEFIESYIKVRNDYQWNDNHGELIRCKDCTEWKVSRTVKKNYCRKIGCVVGEDDFCSKAELKDTTEEVRKQLKDMEQRREMDRKK